MNNSLDLKVILKGIDQLSKSFRAMVGSSGKLQGQIVSTNKTIRDLRSQQKHIESFRSLGKQYRQSGQRVDEAKSQLSKMQDVLKKNSKVTKKDQKSLQATAAKVKKLTTVRDQHKSSLIETSAKLKLAGVNVTKLADAESRLKWKNASVCAA